MVAVFSVGMPEYDQNLIYMPLAAAQGFFRMGGAVSAIDLFVDQPLAVDALRAAVTPALSPDTKLTDWQQANSGFVTALAVR